MKQANHWQQVQQLFDELVQLPVAQQQSRLAELEESSPELWADVSKMLESDAEVEDNTLPKAAAVASQLSEQPKLGTRTGPFELISELGSGGMGTVYLANRVEGNVSQKVAVKFAHGAVLDKKARERFEKEQQILANLEHPGIARLVDVGTTEEGVPYYAMEYITGLPITEYVEKHQLTADQKVDLFQQICEAVSYAHRHLVIHRDLKPANILVNEEGQVKLLDFGIAKLMSGDENDPKQTGTLGIFLSPQYAAPEQFQGRAISFATDVYALGIILYELLSGKLPYDLKGLSLVKMEQIVSNTLPRSLSNAQKFPDLDAICLHCLKKEPDQRYRSIDELLEDLKRYKSFEPIRARKPTQAYKISKFVRRNRAATIISVALAISILAFAGISKYQRDLAIEREQEANAVTDFLVTIFRDADPYRTGNPDITVEELLDKGQEQVQVSGLNDEIVMARVSMALAQAYRGISKWVEAKKLVDAAISIFGQTPEYEGEMLEALLLKANLLSYLSLHQECVEVSKMGLAIAEDIGDLEYVFEFNLMLYVGFANTQQRTAALSYGNRAIYLAQKSQKPLRHARALQQVSNHYYANRQYDRAIELLNDAITSLETLNTSESKFFLAQALRRRARSNVRVGLYDMASFDISKSIDYFVELFGEEHDRVATAYNTMGLIEKSAGNFEGASSAFQKVVSIRRNVLGEDNIQIAYVLFNLATLFHRSIGDLERARQFYSEAIDVAEGSMSENHRLLMRMRLERLAISIDCTEDWAFIESELDKLANTFQALGPGFDEFFEMFVHLRSYWHALDHYGKQVPEKDFNVEKLRGLLGERDEWVVESIYRSRLVEVQGVHRIQQCEVIYSK